MPEVMNMNYGYNNNPYQQPYRPYGQPAWQQPAQAMPQMQQTWQPPVPETMQPEPQVQEPREDPVVAAIRELTAEVLALRKAITAKKKKETDDE